MSNRQEAISSISLARRRLVHEYPFHARFIAQWALRESTTIDTMGVTVEDDAIVLFFEPDFVTSCSLIELGAVLLHEVHHLLFEHVWMWPADYPDRAALVVAQELCANEYISQQLPGKPITLADYPQLPAREDTVTRYRRLARDRRSPDHPQTMDDHSMWNSASETPKHSAAAVKVALAQTISSMSAGDVQKIDGSTINTVANILTGSESGDAVALLDLIRCKRKDVPWRRLLRNFVRQEAEPQPTFMRPPRRFPELLGVVPARTHRPSRASIMVILDTSGSMGPRELALISSEAQAIAAIHDVTVVECDAAIHRVYPFTSALTTMHGRGGTDFRPPLEDAFLAKHRPAAVIYCTDGRGPAPSHPPRVPVLWCLTPTGVRPVVWGREVRLPD